MSTAGDIILSVRKQIPDPVDGEDPKIDGTAFTVNDLIRWINDAGRSMCRAPIIQDWYGIPSIQGQDVYPLPSYITSVEQVWYDLLPLTRAAEIDSLFTSKVVGRSWWQGPHSIHAVPRMYVFPAPDRSGVLTQLNGGITAAALSVTLDTTAAFKQLGYFRLGTYPDTYELCRYATLTSGTVLSNVLRGQGSTIANAWADNTVVQECNLFFKCFRLPRPITSPDDPIEIPEPLWPLIELYILSKVRETEQDHQTAQGMMSQFNGLVTQMADSAQTKGLKQGLQVRAEANNPQLLRGRTFIP